MFAFFSSHPAALNSSPQIQNAAAGTMGHRPVRTSLVESPKTPLLEVSKMDQLEARRGKGLAIASPLGEAEGEKVKGVREEIWREKEEEPAGPPFFLSSLPPLPPSLFLSPPSSSAFFFSSLSFLEKVAGQS